MKRIAICLPYFMVFPAEAVIGLVNLIMHKSERYTVSNVVFGQDCRIDRNRTVITDKALANNPDYLFWMDSDTIIEPDTIDKLLRTEKDVVSALMFYRTKPHHPHSFIWAPEKNNGEGGFNVRHFFPRFDLFKVDGIGFSCVLTAAEIFKEIPSPYFKFIDNPDNPMGEDLYFCKLLRDKGIEIWVDPTVRPKHISTDGIGITEYEDEVIRCGTLEQQRFEIQNIPKQSKAKLT